MSTQNILATTTNVEEEHANLPITEWEVARDADVRPGWARTERLTPTFTTEAYADDYSLLDPRLYRRERPRTLAAATALAVDLALLGALIAVDWTHPLLPAVLFVGVFALAFVLLVVGLNEHEDNGYRLNRRRMVLSARGWSGPELRDAYINDPDKAMTAFHILSKDKEGTTSEAKDLAAGIINRLAEHQRQLDEAEKVRKEAEAAALAEFEATAQITPIAGFADEATLHQLSAELDLQGK